MFRMSSAIFQSESSNALSLTLKHHLQCLLMPEEETGKKSVMFLSTKGTLNYDLAVIQYRGLFLKLMP